MINFEARINKFKDKGDKTGWTYIDIPVDLIEKLKPGTKKSFRVKGKLDKHSIEGVALIPMGGGSFILAVNAVMRKAIGKKTGAMVQVKLTEDKRVYELNKDFVSCLDDEPKAKRNFESMPPSHQRYYSKWIDDAKTESTKVKRIALAVNSLAKQEDFGTMLRTETAKRKTLKGEN